MNTEGIRMKDANGFDPDISQPEYPLPRGMVGIRINVDDFDEIYKMFLEKGFKNAYGDKTAETSSSGAAVLISPTGFGVNLIQHFQKS